MNDPITIPLWDGKQIVEKVVTYYIHNDKHILQIGHKTPIILESTLMRLNPKDKGLSPEQIPLSFCLIYDDTKTFVFQSKTVYRSWVNKISVSTLNIGVFGFPLSVGIKKSGWYIPNPIYRSVQYLRKNDGVNTQGIFRMTAGMEQLEKLRAIVDDDEDLRFESRDDDCIVAASFLKYYLRTLPDSVIPSRYLLDFINLPKQRMINNKFIMSLPEENQNVLWYIFSFLDEVVQKKHINKMNEYNMATCICLVLCSCPEQDVLVTGKLIESVMYLLNHFNEMFADVALRNCDKMSEPEMPAFFNPHIDVADFKNSVKSELKKRNHRRSLTSTLPLNPNTFEGRHTPQTPKSVEYKCVLKTLTPRGSSEFKTHRLNITQTNPQLLSKNQPFIMSSETRSVIVGTPRFKNEVCLRYDVEN
ncbi:hypothetical protein EIN_284930 [Entamoeba invadens IP1]|uniref:Rho-GAP domain-containing protein n=1 Tax=Entamoeba invadens IP1 TaxID=370355 RepID=L7FKH1_ENTIV|nr:hypothetical protein EIN_284930 [Entamoeba invadens IP1]ELP84907.1 hypothetical protein EIN_284930 [Entamoeba invadens IP1]|eukprot:XP_004184253.1 hypothetical protein EIN_284930 [Entamoeba invadens IP1]